MRTLQLSNANGWRFEIELELKPHARVKCMVLSTEFEVISFWLAHDMLVVTIMFVRLIISCVSGRGRVIESHETPDPPPCRL